MVFIAADFVFVAAFLAAVFVGVAIEDRVMERVESVHHDLWNAAGRPMGGWRAPAGAERSIASRQRGLRAMNAWESATTGPVAGDAELVKLLRWRRGLRRWAIVFWLIAFTCMSAPILF